MQLLQRQFLFPNYLFHPGSVCFSPPDLFILIFSLSPFMLNDFLFLLPLGRVSLFNTTDCPSCVQPYLYLEGHLPSASALDCVVREEWPAPTSASSSFLQNWASFCSSGIYPARLLLLKAQRQASPLFLPECVTQEGAVSTAIPVSALQTCSSLPVFLLWLSGFTARKSNPDPSYKFSH